MEPVETTIEIPGLTLAARVWGPPDGKPVLCLHGWLDNAASFDRLAPLLPGLRMVCLDLPGHGLSDHRHPSACYDFIYWVPDVLATADALGWQRFSLLGHSMGGMIASCVAGTFPDRVERTAFIDAIGPLSTDAAEAPERLAAAIRHHRMLAGKSALNRPLPDLEAAVMRLQLAMEALTEETAYILARRGTRQLPSGELAWRHDPRLRGKSLLRLTEAQVTAFLKRITCPVLMIRPEEGWPAAEEAIQNRMGHLLHGELLKVPGGHHVHLVDPQRVAPPLLGFFNAG